MGGLNNWGFLRSTARSRSPFSGQAYGDPVRVFSKREQEVLLLLAAGLSNGPKRPKHFSPSMQLGLAEGSERMRMTWRVVVLTASLLASAAFPATATAVAGSGAFDRPLSSGAAAFDGDVDANVTNGTINVGSGPG